MKKLMSLSIAVSLPLFLAACGGAGSVKPAAEKAAAPAAMAMKDAGCASEIAFASAADDGKHEDGRPPSMAVDGNMDSDSRWSSESEGSPKAITFKLASATKVGGVGVAWLKGDERSFNFSVETSKDGKSFSEVLASRKSTGKSAGIEKYSFTPVDAQYIRVNSNGNTKNKWNSIVEAKAYGC